MVGNHNHPGQHFNVDSEDSIGISTIDRAPSQKGLPFSNSASVLCLHKTIKRRAFLGWINGQFYSPLIAFCTFTAGTSQSKSAIATPSPVEIKSKMSMSAAFWITEMCWKGKYANNQFSPDLQAIAQRFSYKPQKGKCLTLWVWGTIIVFLI